MTDIDGEVRSSAEWISARLQSLGYAADFRPVSLREIDRFFADNFDAGVPRRRFRREFARLVDPSGRAFGFAFVAYVGEVIRQAVGGEWVTDDCASAEMFDMQLVLPSGRALMPLIQVVRCMGGGQEGSLAAFGVDCGLVIPP
jgi:hypothetical protein